MNEETLADKYADQLADYKATGCQFDPNDVHWLVAEIRRLKRREVKLTRMVAFCRSAFFDISQGVALGKNTDDVTEACAKAFSAVTNAEELAIEINAIKESEGESHD